MWIFFRVSAARELVAGRPPPPREGKLHRERPTASVPVLWRGGPPAGARKGGPSADCEVREAAPDERRARALPPSPPRGERTAQNQGLLEPSGDQGRKQLGGAGAAARRPLRTPGGPRGAREFLGPPAPSPPRRKAPLNTSHGLRPGTRERQAGRWSRCPKGRPVGGLRGPRGSPG